MSDAAPGPGFDPTLCDLCGSPDSAPLVGPATSRAMRSDRVVVERPLRKLACRRCGLVRGGEAIASGSLDAYYAEQYRQAPGPEHEFYTPQGPVARSRVFADWLQEAAPEAWSGARSVLEIGAGAGHLLRELAGRLPSTRFEGLEPGQAAAALARQAGLTVARTAEPAGGARDLVYSIAVIEHTASPTAFLEQARSRLPDGGWLLLSQPTQDVPSYDVFFVDHLYHFGSAHLREYGRKCGFREERVLIGHPLMPNFSLHVWRSAAPAGAFRWTGPPFETTCAATATRIVNDMARLDRTLERLAAAQRRVAVFGLNEVYWLARAYSRLGEFPVVCGLDDRPDRPEYAALGFEVRRPETCVALGVSDVILAMNKIYYDQAERRLEALGLATHRLLS